MLQKAEKQGWSVGELKKQIQLLRQGADKPDPDTENENGGDPEKKKVSPDWGMLVKTLERQTAQLASDLSLLSLIQMRGDIPKDLRQNIRSVVRLLILHNLVNRSFVEEQMPETTAAGVAA